MTLNEIITKLREDASQMESPFYTKTPADPGWDYTAKAFREIADELEATTRGVSEKMDYRESAKELADEYSAGFSESWKREAAKAVLALLDKVRQAQAAECAKHKPSFNSESCMADGCDWKFGNGKITWSEHISALGRK